MMRRFCSGSVDAGQPGQEALAGVDHDQVHAQVLLEGRPEQLRLLLAHQAVVDVDAGQPVADGAMDERRRDGRVDAARQRADDLAVDAGGLGVRVDARRISLTVESMKLAGVQVWPRAGDADHEVAQHVAAVRRVDDLGVELDAVQAALRVDEAGERGRVGLRGRAGSPPAGV